MSANRLRRIIDHELGINDEISMENKRKKCISLVKSKIQPLEMDYLNGKYSFQEFFSKMEPIQRQIASILKGITFLPLNKQTFRYARPGEMFATETLIKRINNAEEPDVYRAMSV